MKHLHVLLMSQIKALCWAQCKPIIRGVSFPRELTVHSVSEQIGGMGENRNGVLSWDDGTGLVK